MGLSVGSRREVVVIDGCDEAREQLGGVEVGLQLAGRRLGF